MRHERFPGRAALSACFRLSLLSTLFGLFCFTASATILNALPGAPVLPVLVPPNGVIFDLDGVNAGGVQLGSDITPFGTNPGPDLPATGGVCASFVTGELCPTLEPGAGFGIRDWEVELANDTGGPATPAFIAAFRAPGLAQAWIIPALLPGQGVLIDLRYIGPTLPLFGVASFLPFSIDIATSIIDPFSFTPFAPEPFAAPGLGLPALPVENDSLIGSAQLTDNDGVPEPRTFFLIGAGLLALGLLRRKARG